ncbi:MAG: aminoacyl--tRNA ligase-related protein [Candidatus Paceibacterota bacterium]
MKQSSLFYTAHKDAPKDEQSINAQLLIRAGFIDKLSAGVYSYLPLGLRVCNKIENIIREELLKIGAQELIMPAMHPKENWQVTGRWDSMTDLYKISEGEKELALGPTHEEIIVPLAKKYIHSWQDLPLTNTTVGEFPLSLFQFQTKFRKELRAKSGILRTREFLMKDLYSFHRDEADLEKFYAVVENAYENIFRRLGIIDKVYYTYASGGTFSKYSHEYQLLTPSGEDTIYVCENCEAAAAQGESSVGVAINKEIKPDLLECPKCHKTVFREEKSIEIANIFKLITKFSSPFELSYTDENSEKKLVIMGCYGIGIGRLMGSIAEVFHDEKGVIWPKSVAPFDVHLIRIDSAKENGQTLLNEAQRLYQELQSQGFSVLYDDRLDSAGKKLIDADLLGIPVRVVISPKTLEKNGVEIKLRNHPEMKVIATSELLGFLRES